MRLCIAVLTTATRGDTLSECLNSLSTLTIPDIEKLTVLIVQNRKEESSDVNAAVKNMVGTDKLTFATRLETNLGIPMARNNALRFAQENGFTHLGFIDDDAKPATDWLLKMVDVLERQNVEAVTGPQVPIFPEGTSHFYKAAKVYKERELKDGTECRWAATNNVIFDVNFAKRNDLIFSEDMRTGGSDKEYFSRYTKKGARILWVKEAIVSEYVEPNRINFKWAIKRTFRFGGTGYRIEKCTKSNSSALFSCLFKGGVYIAKGFANLIVLPFKKDRSFIDGLCDISHGSAFILSIFSGGKLKRYT